ncbi:alpha/beta fold hydrolase [Iamia majanohamensis]|uniref:Alpha/beta fold hydrolase n=1 Tax=Iamia majanohamensis TaxID=467976 RepID=A0AAE9Y4S0_9ACTN|nr:alpha/beta fold hydrolase [Iamia majanohamensis]WCO66394.1 alpha/beta fold hydrolase [Iamia majanohamensis]
MTAPIIEGAEPFHADGDDRGVLVVHGFTGNPHSMRPVAEALAGAGFTVDLPLLPGHGTAVADMLETGFDDWLAEAERAYGALAATCRTVAVVGLSMGGALTAWLASEHAEISGIACLNAVVTPPEGMREGLEEMLAAGQETMDGIGSDIAKEGVAESAYPETPLRPLLTLFDAAAELEGRLGRISCPVLVVNSPQDHVVDPANSDVLAASVAGPVERVTAPDSFHVVTLDHDGPAVVAAIVDFCTRVSTTSP